MDRITLGALAAALILPATTLAQEKRALDHDAYDVWKSIVDQVISADGRWISYALNPREGDAELYVRNTQSEVSHTLARGRQARFSADGRFLVFIIKPELDLVREARKGKKKPDQQPKDSLGILDLAGGEVTRVEKVKSFALPEDGTASVAYLLERMPEKPEATDTSEMEPEEQQVEQQAQEEEEKKEKRDSEIGSTLVLRNLSTGTEQSYESVTEYTFSEDGKRLVYLASSKDGTADGAYVVEVETGSADELLTGEGIYESAVFDEDGDQIAFLSNRDDYQADSPEFKLYYWRSGRDEARALAAEGSEGVPTGWRVSEHGDLEFSDNGRRLFFGTAPRPEPDPEEEVPEWEKVDVDVWNWRDPLIQPMQLVRREQELNRSCEAVVEPSSG